MSIDGERVGSCSRCRAVGAAPQVAAPPPRRLTQPSPSRRRVSRRSPGQAAGASGDLADCARPVRASAKERQTAQSRRRDVERARAGQGGRARREHHVPQPTVGARRDARVCRSCVRTRRASTCRKRGLGAYLRSVEIVGPYRRRPGRATRRSRRRIFACRPTTAVRANRVREDDSLDAGAPRVSPAGDRRRHRAAAGDSIEEGRDRRSELRRGHRARARAAARQPGVPVPRRARSGEHANRTRAYRISDLELASRLSFFLWSSIPGRRAARCRRANGQLKDAGRAERAGPPDAGRSARRTRSSRTSPGSGCTCATCDAAVPVASIFPDFDDSLRQAFRRETELFFDSIVREDRSALDLLRADYTFLNERLARHYGIPNIKGSHFRRVTLDTGQRARRAARSGQHSDGDVASRSHVAGRARQVDSREPARHAAAAAAAERAGAEADDEAGRRAVDARAHGAASRQPGVRQLPRDDGSARPVARELRRGRASGARSASRRRRSTRRARCRTARSSRARPGSAATCCCARIDSCRR